MNHWQEEGTVSQEFFFTGSRFASVSETIGIVACDAFVAHDIIGEAINPAARGWSFRAAFMKEESMLFQKLNSMKKSTAAVLAILLAVACVADVYQTQWLEDLLRQEGNLEVQPLP